MGLIKLALVGGAGYWIGSRAHQNRRSNRANEQEPQQPQQQRNQSYQPNYYDHTEDRGENSEYYHSPPSEKRSQQQYQQRQQYEEPQRLPHEKPLQLNFVSPSQQTRDMAMHPGRRYGGPGALDRI
jgi:hypothetical protein